MAGPLENLRSLREELAQRGWVLTCFEFTFNNQTYFTLARRYIPPETPPEYSLLELTFIDQGDHARRFTAPANTQRIQATARQIREYFGIEWSSNLGDAIAHFLELLGYSIPRHIPTTLSVEQENAVLIQLHRSNSEDPRKRYCFSVRRNPERADGSLGQRSDFNSQKTEMLRPELFACLQADRNISFCYSTDPEDERTDTQILADFSGH